MLQLFFSIAVEQLKTYITNTFTYIDQVYTFGCNDDGALGRSTTEEGSEHNPQRVDLPELIVQISAGDSHSAALSESGQVYIWGNFRVRTSKYYSL